MSCVVCVLSAGAYEARQRVLALADAPEGVLPALADTPLRKRLLAPPASEALVVYAAAAAEIECACSCLVLYWCPQLLRARSCPSSTSV